MRTSAFEILVAPILWATIGTFLAGAVIRVLMNAVAALVDHLRRTVRSFKTVPQADRNRLRPCHGPIAREVGSNG